VEGAVWEIRSFSWSPDSKWVAYARPEVDSMDKIYLYSLGSRQSLEVTDGWYESGNPVFSADGKYLFFTSDREFNPFFGLTEFNHVYRDMARVYFVTLAKETESPFKPKSDEVGVESPKPEPAKGKEEAKKAVLVVKVDADGLKERLVDLPIQAATYR